MTDIADAWKGVEMGIPYGTKFTAKTSGSTWKQVVCQYCQCDFVYKATRSAESSETSVLWLNNDAAKVKAYTDASKRLGSALENAFDMIHCPNCGKYQENMWQELMRRARSSNKGTGFLLGVIMVIFLPLVLSIFGLEYWIGLLIGFSIAVVLRVFYSRKEIEDPNKSAHLRTRKTYSDNYPVLLTSEFVTLFEAEKESK